MQRQESQETGWEFVADREAAPAVFAALLRLDTDDTYTMTELAESADVPLKTLYVNDWLDDLCALDVLSEVDTDADQETTYRIDDDSDLLAAAEFFDETFASVAADEE